VNTKALAIKNSKFQHRADMLLTQSNTI